MTLSGTHGTPDKSGNRFSARASDKTKIERRLAAKSVSLLLV
jgi:hypothetical protein